MSFILGVTISHTKVNSLTCTRTIDICTLNTLKDNAVCNFKGILSKELRYKVRFAYPLHEFGNWGKDPTGMTRETSRDTKL
jgi:hypothetical protein